MDLVHEFKTHLKALYRERPPIPKEKIKIIASAALKANKMYKHIVMYVEKFLVKCPTRYKLSALYIIDSIIRLSRKSLGHHKDMFGPRFKKNLKFTFLVLKKCHQKQKTKILRILTLWQKHLIFPNEVVAPLIQISFPNAKEPLLQTNSQFETDNHNLNTVQMIAANALAIIQQQQTQIQALQQLKALNDLNALAPNLVQILNKLQYYQQLKEKDKKTSIPNELVRQANSILQMLHNTNSPQELSSIQLNNIIAQGTSFGEQNYGQSLASTRGSSFDLPGLSSDPKPSNGLDYSPLYTSIKSNQAPPTLPRDKTFLDDFDYGDDEDDAQRIEEQTRRVEKAKQNASIELGEHDKSKDKNHRDVGKKKEIKKKKISKNGPNKSPQDIRDSPTSYQVKRIDKELERLLTTSQNRLRFSQDIYDMDIPSPLSLDLHEAPPIILENISPQLNDHSDRDSLAHSLSVTPVSIYNSPHTPSDPDPEFMRHTVSPISEEDSNSDTVENALDNKYNIFTSSCNDEIQNPLETENLVANSKSKEDSSDGVDSEDTHSVKLVICTEDQNDVTSTDNNNNNNNNHNDNNNNNNNNNNNKNKNNSNNIRHHNHDKYNKNKNNNNNNEMNDNDINNIDINNININNININDNKTIDNGNNIMDDFNNKTPNTITPQASPSRDGSSSNDSFDFSLGSPIISDNNDDLNELPNKKIDCNNLVEMKTKSLKRNTSNIISKSTREILTKGSLLEEELDIVTCIDDEYKLDSPVSNLREIEINPQLSLEAKLLANGNNDDFTLTVTANSRNKTVEPNLQTNMVLDTTEASSSPLLILDKMDIISSREDLRLNTESNANLNNAIINNANIPFQAAPAVDMETEPTLVIKETQVEASKTSYQSEQQEMSLEESSSEGIIEDPSSTPVQDSSSSENEEAVASIKSNKIAKVHTPISSPNSYISQITQSQSSSNRDHRNKHSRDSKHSNRKQHSSEYSESSDDSEAENSTPPNASHRKRRRSIESISSVTSSCISSITPPSSINEVCRLESISPPQENKHRDIYSYNIEDLTDEEVIPVKKVVVNTVVKKVKPLVKRVNKKVVSPQKPLKSVIVVKKKELPKKEPKIKKTNNKNFQIQKKKINTPVSSSFSESSSFSQSSSPIPERLRKIARVIQRVKHTKKMQQLRKKKEIFLYSSFPKPKASRKFTNSDKTSLEPIKSSKTNVKPIKQKPSPPRIVKRAKMKAPIDKEKYIKVYSHIIKIYSHGMPLERHQLRKFLSSYVGEIELFELIDNNTAAMVQMSNRQSADGLKKKFELKFSCVWVPGFKIIPGEIIWDRLKGIARIPKAMIKEYPPYNIETLSKGGTVKLKDLDFVNLKNPNNLLNKPANQRVVRKFSNSQERKIEVILSPKRKILLCCQDSDGDAYHNENIS